MHIIHTHLSYVNLRKKVYYGRLSTACLVVRPYVSPYKSSLVYLE